jgi:hypothetical protein
MALTRPKIWDIDTNIQWFNDPITVLHQGSTVANVDVGFLFNRANGLVSNVAMYWSESANSFVTSFTANSGATDSNIAATGYANLTIGSLLSVNGNIYLNGSTGTPGQYITSTSSGTAWTSSSYTGGAISSNIFPTANLTVTLGGASNYFANVYTGNLIISNAVTWANGTVFSSGSGGASYTTGNVIITNATGVLPNIYMSTSGVGSPNSGYIKNYWSDINTPTKEIGGVFPYFNIKPTNNAYAYNSLTPINLYDGGSAIWSMGYSVGQTGGDLFSTSTIAGSYYLNVANASVVTANTNGAIVFATTGKARFRIQYDGNTYIMGNTTITGNALSNSTTTGAVVVTGGVGVGGNIAVGGNILVSDYGIVWSSNGQPYSGGSSYGNVQMLANLAASNNPITIGSNLTVSGNLTAANIVTTGTYGNITGANVVNANTFVVSNGIFWANGTAYSSGSSYGNTQMLANLAATSNPITFGSSITIPNTGDVSANVAGLYNSILGANAAIVTANSALKSYTDNQITTANSAVVSYVNTLNTAMASNVAGANAAIVTANTAMKGYVDTANSAVVSYVNTLNTAMASNVAGANAAIVTANSALKSYTDDQITTANNAVVAYVNTLNSAMASNVAGANAAIVTANTALKSYVDTQDSAITTAWTSNAATQQSQITTLQGQVYANANVAAYLPTYAGAAAVSTLTASGITQITNSTAATNLSTGAVQVTGGASVGGNLWVGGNIYAVNIFGVNQDVITIQDPLVYLQALGNLSTYNYDIGFYSDYSAPGYRHTGLARSFASNTWAFFSNLASEPDVAGINWNDVGIAYDTVKMGQLIVANTTTSTSTTTGALQVAGGVGIAGTAYIQGSVAIGASGTTAGSLLTVGPTNGMSSKLLTVSDMTNPITSASAGGILVSIEGGGGIYMSSGVTGGSVKGKYEAYASSLGIGTMSAHAVQISTSDINRLNISSSGIVTVTNTAVATSTSTGALIVNGGAGISGNVFSGGYHYINPTSVTDVAGGGYGTAIAVPGNNWGIYANIGQTGSYYFRQVIGKDTGNNIVIGHPTSTSLNANINVNPGSVNGYFNVVNSPSSIPVLSVNTLANNVVISNAQTATSTTTGALIVSGGVGIAGNLFAGNAYLGYGLANYATVTGAPTGNAVITGTAGSDTNISYAIQSKGTGNIDLQSQIVNISNGGTVTSLVKSATGTSYTSVPTITISAPTTANGVTATANITMILASATIANVGYGYSINDVLTIVGTTGPDPNARVTVTGNSATTYGAGGISAISVSNNGALYSFPSNPFSITGGTGTGATFNGNFGLGGTITVLNAGSGYVEQPTVTFSGGGGSGAAAFATVGSQTVFKSLGSGTGTITNQSLMFQTPSGNSLLLRDGNGIIDAHVMVVGTSFGYAQIMAEGSNANGSLYVGAKGTGSIRFSTQSTSITEQMRVTNTTSAVNYVQVTGAATGARPVISAQGSDGNVNLTLQSKGTFGFTFQNSLGGSVFAATHTNNSSQNYLQLVASLNGSYPYITSQGPTDTNIDLGLIPKGTGNVTTANPVFITNANVSTSNVTGALIVSGGVGVTGNVNASGNVYAIGTNSRHGYTWANSISSAYTVFNSAANSVDLIFG